MIEFVYEIEIKENLLDTFGHVNNANYLNLYEQARWDFITKRGFGLAEIKSKKVGPVLLDAYIKFKKELRNREKITIKSKAQDISHNLIMGMHQEMIKEDGEVASSLDIKVGLMDMEKRKLVSPTKEWLQAIGHES